MHHVTIDVQEQGTVLLLVHDVILDDLVVHRLARGDDAGGGGARARGHARRADRHLRAIALFPESAATRCAAPGVVVAAVAIMIARVLRRRKSGDEVLKSSRRAKARRGVPVRRTMPPARLDNKYREILRRLLHFLPPLGCPDQPPRRRELRRFGHARRSFGGLRGRLASPACRRRRVATRLHAPPVRDARDSRVFPSCPASITGAFATDARDRPRSTPASRASRTPGSSPIPPLPGPCFP